MLRDREYGQVEWSMGLFGVLFLAVVLYSQLQVEVYHSSARYLEDALAASNLASAVIDMKEYGKSRKVLLTDFEEAYDRFCVALKGNLQLDDAWECKNKQLISGTVQVESYIVYNVIGELVSVCQMTSDGGMLQWQGILGAVKAPNGIAIECTGVYSEISYDVQGFGGVVTRACKGKLVDVAVMNEVE